MANNQLLESLHLRGFLSFGPGSEPVKLTRLNVLVGPNGVGKSNFIEAVQLLHAAPTDFAGAIRTGGMPSDWIWHGEPECCSARIEAVLTGSTELRYGIEFTESGGRLEITDEVLEKERKNPFPEKNNFFYYHFMNGHPVVNAAQETAKGNKRRYLKRVLKREDIDPQQSILSQIKERDSYPEITETGKCFKDIQIYREWTSGSLSVLRSPLPGNLPADVLHPYFYNLGLVINELEHRPEWERFNELMRRFLPRYTRLSTRLLAGSIQIYLHEDGLRTPISVAHLSDGTLRFLTLLAILLNPGTAPLICIDEPESGLHPDAMSILAELLVETSIKPQIIVTTHSDALISELTEHADSVLVCDYGQNGTELSRLDPDKLEHWLGKYRLGDIWRAGKIGGNP